MRLHLRIICVFVVEVENIVEHLLGLHRRAFGVYLNGGDIFVYRLMPFALLAVLVAPLVMLFT